MTTTAASSRRGSGKSRSVGSGTPARSSGGRGAQAQRPLAGVVVYVDAYLNDRTSMKSEYGACLRGMGADVRSRLPKKLETLTHLVWKDGNEEIAQRAADAGVTLVSDSWVYGCKQVEGRAPETEHPASFVHVPRFSTSGERARKPPQSRRRTTLEPTNRQWEEVDRDDGRCFSSSQREGDRPTSESDKELSKEGTDGGASGDQSPNVPGASTTPARGDRLEETASTDVVEGYGGEINDPLKSSGAGGGGEGAVGGGSCKGDPAGEFGAGIDNVTDTEAETSVRPATRSRRVAGRNRSPQERNTTPAGRGNRSGTPGRRRSWRSADESTELETVGREAVETPRLNDSVSTPATVVGGSDRSVESARSLGSNGSEGDSGARAWQPGGRGLLGRGVLTRRSGSGAGIGAGIGAGGGCTSMASTPGGRSAAAAFRKGVLGSSKRNGRGSTGGRGSSAFDLLSEDGEAETENTVVDSTDAERKGGETIGGRSSATEADSSSESDAFVGRAGGVGSSAKRPRRRRESPRSTDREPLSPKPTNTGDSSILGISPSTPGLRTPAWLANASANRSRLASEAEAGVLGSRRSVSTAPKTYVSSRKRLSSPNFREGVGSPVPPFSTDTENDTTEIEGAGGRGEGRGISPVGNFGGGEGGMGVGDEADPVNDIRRGASQETVASTSTAEVSGDVEEAAGDPVGDRSDHESLPPPLVATQLSEGSRRDLLQSSAPDKSVPPTPVGTPRVPGQAAAPEPQGHGKAPEGGEGAKRIARKLRGTTPASGYAADRSEGTLRVSRARSRTQRGGTRGRKVGEAASREETGSSARASGTVGADEDGWVCQQCTLLNQPKKRRCVACNAYPPVGGSTGTSSATSEGSWNSSSELAVKRPIASKDGAAGRSRENTKRAAGGAKGKGGLPPPGAEQSTTGGNNGGEEPPGPAQESPGGEQAASGKDVGEAGSPVGAGAAEAVPGETRRLAAGEACGGDGGGTEGANIDAGPGARDGDDAGTAVVRLFANAAGSSSVSEARPTAGEGGVAAGGVGGEELNTSPRGSGSDERGVDGTGKGNAAAGVRGSPVEATARGGGGAIGWGEPEGLGDGAERRWDGRSPLSEPDTVEKAGQRDSDAHSWVGERNLRQDLSENTDGEGEEEAGEEVREDATGTAVEDAATSTDGTASVHRRKKGRGVDDSGSTGNANTTNSSSGTSVAQMRVRRGGRRAGSRTSAALDGDSSSGKATDSGALSANSGRSREREGSGKAGVGGVTEGRATGEAEMGRASVAGARPVGTRRSPRRSPDAVAGVSPGGDNCVATRPPCSQEEMMQAAFLLGTLGGSGASDEGRGGDEDDDDLRRSGAIAAVGRRGSKNGRQLSSDGASSRRTARRGVSKSKGGGNESGGRGSGGDAVDVVAAAEESEARDGSGGGSVGAETPASVSSGKRAAGKRSRSTSADVGPVRGGEDEPDRRSAGGGRPALRRGRSRSADTRTGVGDDAPVVGAGSKAGRSLKGKSRKGRKPEGAPQAPGVEQVDKDSLNAEASAVRGSQAGDEGPSESSSRRRGGGKGRRVGKAPTAADRGPPGDRSASAKTAGDGDDTGARKSSEAVGVDDTGVAGVPRGGTRRGRGKRRRGLASSVGPKAEGTGSGGGPRQRKSRGSSTEGGISAKRKRGEGGGRSRAASGKRVKNDKVPADADGEGSSGKDRSERGLQGPVRMAFSGLLQGDRQAATSVVRSLAKGHKAAGGARVCSSEDEPFTHLVIPDESRRTLKVLFALCASLAPNGRPPAVVTVAWLYASLEAGFFVDSEAFCPARYRGPDGGKESVGRGASEGRGTVASISSQLLRGQRVMIAGVSDPPPEVSESLVKAAGAEIADAVTDATLVLAESETQLESWVSQRKAEASGAQEPPGRDRGSKLRRLGRGPGRVLERSTSSSRNAASGEAAGRVGSASCGGMKLESGMRPPMSWGEAEDSALVSLKASSCVVRMPWVFDSVEKGTWVDRSTFAIGATPSESGSSRSGGLEDDVTQSQEW